MPDWASERKYQMKLKSINTSKSKISEVEGERRVTFVASTNAVDRDFEIVKIETFRLPLKGGGFTIVGSIPDGGITNVDLPLLTNHDMTRVENTIGSVRKAEFIDGKLIFECGISSTDFAQGVFKLIDEGHLDNAFSIRFRDYEFNTQTGENTAGEIVEVSLVTRGSNPESQILAVKSMKGAEMDEANAKIAELETEIAGLKAKQNEVFGDATGTEAPKAEEPKVEEAQLEEKVETPEEPKEAEEVKTEEKEEAPKEEIKPTKGKSMNTTNEIAKEQVKSFADQGLNVVANDYLKSKSAMKDFRETILKYHRGDNAKIMEDWADQVKAKGLSGDAILPSRIEQIFFQTWSENGSILSTFKRSSTKALKVNALTGEGEGILAKGHKKGEQKDEQDIENLQRSLMCLPIYKKLSFHLQDLFNDETGDLLQWRVEELAERIASMIAIGAILGDGRTAGTPDYRVFRDGEGLYSMKDDINGTADFQKAVATKITGLASDNVMDLVVKVRNAVKGKGSNQTQPSKILIVPEGFMTELETAKTTNGDRLFPIGTDFAMALRVKAIYELEEMVPSATVPSIICYADQSYTLIGEGATKTYTDFDLNTNKDIMLQEQFVAGSLTGRKTAAGIFEAEA